MVVGQLQGSVDGRPFSLVGEESSLTLNLDGVATFRTMLKGFRRLLGSVQRLRLNSLPRVRVNVKGLPGFSVKPNSLLVKLVLGAGKS